MKIIDFSELYSTRFAITDISVIYQTNLWSECNHLDGRIYNGFLLFKDGSCTYEWDGNRETISKGTLIYLPRGSRHKVTAKERSLNFYRINFTVRDTDSGEELVFSDRPTVICNDTPLTLFGVCENMCAASLTDSGVFKNLSGISEIFDFVRHCTKKIDDRRIAPALSYIEDHYTEDFSVTALADMCYLSEAHLFRLFKNDIGMSPIEYKNHLRIKKAKELLLDRECYIGDISAMVGFENFCYFSRIFKRIVGHSPTEYRRAVN